MPMPNSRIGSNDARRARSGGWLRVPCAGAAPALVAACEKKPAPTPHAAIQVTVTTVMERDTLFKYEFTAQTQSPREVESRARVDGFLEKRVCTEGSFVKAGRILFLMDTKPFEATVQSARGELSQQMARLTVAKANLARMVPLIAQNALSQTDLDDATGSEKEAEAAVIAARGQARTAELNLRYTTLKSPLTGLTRFARQQVALRDVGDSLIGLQKSREVLIVQGRGVDALRTYARLARLRCEGGYRSYMEVFDAERSLFKAQLSGRVFNSMVTLYKSMGGGWVTGAERMTATMSGANGVPVAPDAAAPSWRRRHLPGARRGRLHE
jgi:multidrug efflux pump subunit AcrA (membrane-fusion protein)